MYEGENHVPQETDKSSLPCGVTDVDSRKRLGEHTRRCQRNSITPQTFHTVAAKPSESATSVVLHEGSGQWRQR